MTTVLTLTVLESRLTPTVRILPLGDSITQGGYFNSASYRYPLWEQLQQAGDSDIDFVGSHNIVYNEGSGNPDLANYPNYYSSFDRDNDGYWGYRTDQVLPLMPSIAAAARPDIVMLMLGTNDLGQMGQAGVAPAAANLGRIIDGLRAVNPAVDVLLAEIIPIGPDASGTGSYYTTGSAWVSEFNAQVVAVAAAKNTPQSPVVVVDQFTGFNMSTDVSSDGVHPSRAGESRIANNFFQALARYLPATGSPASVQTVVVNAGQANTTQRSIVTNVAVTFNTVVTFNGQPQNAFQLTRTGPGTPNGNVVLGVDLTGSTATQTVAKITFSGSLTEGSATTPSLVDGNYALTVFSSGISVGLSGGDKTSSLFRLFGDVNGDRTVNITDLTAFRNAFGTISTDTSFLPFLDFNGDGVINLTDLTQFRSRFGVILP